MAHGNPAATMSVLLQCCASTALSGAEGNCYTKIIKGARCVQITDEFYGKPLP